MNQEVFAAVADALDRGEPAALVTIVSTTGSHAAARGCEDARLRRWPHRRDDRRRLLRERRVLEGARGDHEPPAAARALRAVRRLRAGDRARSAADRWTSTSSRSSRRPSSTSSAPATSASTSRGLAHEVGFRVHVVDDREKFANAERFPTAAEIVVEDIPAWIERTTIPAACLRR